MTLVEQDSLSTLGNLQPRAAEIVSPALEERKGRAVPVAGHGGGECWQILPDQLFLQIDRVRGHDRAFLVGFRPPQRRDQIRERLSHAGPRLEDRHPSLVVHIGDVRGHIPLAGSVFELPQTAGQRGVRGEQAAHLERVEGGVRARGGDLDDDIQRFRRIVDDREAHPPVVQLRGHTQIGR